MGSSINTDNSLYDGGPFGTYSSTFIVDSNVNDNQSIRKNNAPYDAFSMFAPFMYVPSDANSAAPTGNPEYGLYEPFLAERKLNSVNKFIAHANIHHQKQFR
jgi:hypothetical protein